jgi:hypothetical protein
MTEPRFCEQCGVRLVPLDIPHVQRPCADCGKTTYVVEPGEGGKGIKVQAGDRFTIPAGWLSLSLDPSKSAGRLFRPGVTWFVTNLMTGNLPKDVAGLDDYLKKCEEQADALLAESEKLKHLDIENEADAPEAIELIEKDRSSLEWWALMVGALESDLRDRMKSEEIPEAILVALRLQACKSMIVYKQSLEEHVWTGYKHTRLIYDLVSAGAQTSAEAEAIQALRSAFAKLDEDVLHAWIESGSEIGPRIGVTQVPEEILRGLAKYHMSLFERRRKEERLDRDQRSSVWANRISAAGVAAVATGTVMGILVKTGVIG